MHAIVLYTWFMFEWGVMTGLEEAPTPPPPPLSEEEKDRLFEKLAGCWADDPEDAARMEAAIKECRIR